MSESFEFPDPAHVLPGTVGVPGVRLNVQLTDAFFEPAAARQPSDPR